VVEHIRAVAQDSVALESPATNERPAGPEQPPESTCRRLRSFFGSAWEAMPTEEQARVLGRLIERVDYDGAQGKLTIRFSAAGIQTLAGEAPTNERIP
jgi:hypothetical protein